MITPFASVFRCAWRGHARTLMALLAAASVAGFAAPAAAQTSSASLSGYVRNSSGGPVSGAEVGARSVGTNALRGTTTNANGFYYIGGLVPGQYDVTLRAMGLAPQTRRVSLFVGQTLSLDLSSEAVTTRLSEVQVTAAANGTGGNVRSTEVGMNVTQAQVNNLPTPSRNFLDLAQLAPGVTVTQDRLNGTGKTFSAGALPAEQINVFIDGASYKNDIITGGVAGQDASRGNPFPRNAIQEFRVITNNFRAEYQKAASAIITAVTKSGTNEWHGSLFADIQNQSLVSLDTFQIAAKQTKPNYKRYLMGFSAGGPIVKDKL
ncbi:MAG: carboxypeptidase regulatory-like domain-containing protein, partial [Gemmatimonadota bacterium]|nr:carboxypeptidase regulatory-like domain-containing protein [Gemmatimonadota bacterium]